jgi:tRNA U34 5-methylaminomethyl-2-thiouridine-forming methyltransferase MnmC
VENIQLIQTDDGSSSLLNLALNETYHSTHGAIQESTHVFIKNGLQFFAEQNHTPVSVFEVGFGTGLNALLSLTFSEQNKINVDYTSLEPFPIGWEVAMSLNYAAQLKDNNHQCFPLLHQSPWGEKIKISEYFSLHKEKITLQDFNFLPDQYDVIFFDAFAPSKQPEMWALPEMKKIVNTLKTGGIVVTYCAKGQVKRDLKSLQMRVESLPGPPGKREMIRSMKLGTLH